MKNIAKPLRTVLELALLLALVVGLVVVFRSLTPGEPASPPLEDTPYPPPGDEIPPNIPSPTGPYPPPVDAGPSPAWTDEPMPTEPTTPTDPPVPTLMPTPVVTPIPLAAPPFLPGLEGKTALPFWIYYWFDNQIWRVDSEGQDRELLLDAYENLGEWLSAVQMGASDCCTFGPRVSLSPDGLTIAFVVVDK